MVKNFKQDIENGYTFKGESIVLGAAMINGQTQTHTLVKVPLKTLNRHGLITGTTGSGKTKTLQVLSEHLSKKGIPVLLMDVKGDLSGLAVASDGHPKIDERHQKIGIPFKPESMPVEFLRISNDYGCSMRATVSEFGPVLLSKILGLSEAQSSIISVLFKYADDKKLPLLDLKDLKKLLQFSMEGGKKELEENYGRMHPSSITSILRKAVELEDQGGNLFFGEPSFDINDLLRVDTHGNGIISILRVTDIQDKPKLFSTFMLCLLAEVYSTFPEEGDMDKPKLTIFIDEAHLVFKEASSSLLSQIESVIKLIRSKGVGIFFITQNMADVPESVLGQIGMKIQHALRAFTAKDRKTIKLASENYPISKYYDTTIELTELGIGEALVSVLDENGRPTPLVRCMIRAPLTRMNILTTSEIDRILKQSKLYDKYVTVIDRKSAYEILQKKVNKSAKVAEKAVTKRGERKKTSVFKEVVDSTLGRQVTRILVREFMRGLLGVLGGKK